MTGWPADRFKVEQIEAAKAPEVPSRPSPGVDQLGKVA